MEEKIISSVQFKRGTKEALERILIGDNKPLKGEPIWETDTNKLKLGDGVSSYSELPYLSGGSSEPQTIVVLGYYDEKYDMFWKESQKINPLPRLDSKLYKNLDDNLLYYLDNSNKYNTIFTIANAKKYGLIKLYDDIGQNTDGTMTQKSITDNLNTKCRIKDVSKFDENITFEQIKY